TLFLIYGHHLHAPLILLRIECDGVGSDPAFEIARTAGQCRKFDPVTDIESPDRRKPGVDDHELLDLAQTAGGVENLSRPSIQLGGASKGLVCEHAGTTKTA